MRKPINPLMRFYRLTEERGDCLVWQGTTARGYGSFRPGSASDSPKVRAHRWIYEQKVGLIPEGYEIDHLCKNPLCVRTSHLEPVSHRENMRRARLNTCRAGKHDLTNPDNVKWDSQGRRRGCKLCARESALQWYHANKEVDK